MSTQEDKPKIFRVSEDEFYVESSSPEKKFCYRVVMNTEELRCTCGDFTTSIKKNPEYRCEHISALVNSNGNFLDFERSKPKLDDRFITNIQGNEFVVYSGILDLAHQKGLKAISVEAIQYPTENNGFEAICKATVESEDGQTFKEVGDANPKNVNTKVVRHILRVAATRAKARALRDLVNIGMTCLEEIDDLDDEIPETKPKNQPLKFEKPAEKKTARKPPVKPPKQESEEKPVEGPKEDNQPKQEEPENQPKMSSAQLKAIENLSKRRGLSKEELQGLAKQSFSRSYEDLSSAEASSFIRSLQQSA